MTRARSEGLALCHVCGLTSRLPSVPAGHAAHCPRCDAELHARKVHAVSRSWALLIAAFVMSIPANLLPVSTIVFMGSGSPDTIMSGVNTLFHHGDAPVALLLFFASIAVPFLKMLALAFLLLSVQFRSTWRPHERTRLYAVVETIGRWSMLDIFVIALLVALVQLQALATIEAGAGAVAFCAVVVLTMFAAESFDPRLIWDVVEEQDP